MSKKLVVKDMQKWGYETLAEMGVSKVYGQKFAWNILPFLAIQKPEVVDGKYSASSVIDKLKVTEYSFYETDSWSKAKIEQKLHGMVILSLWQFFYKELAKSWMVTPQTKETAIASGVPIVLWAYKHIHGINYSSWNRKDPNLRYLLTENLKWLRDPQPIPADIPPFNELREMFLTTGTTGAVNEVTSPKASRIPEYKEFNNLPKYQRYMYLQTWIYHSSIRSENMITDWEDWDAQREPVDSSDMLKVSDPLNWDGPRVPKITKEKSYPPGDELPW